MRDLDKMEVVAEIEDFDKDSFTASARADCSTSFVHCSSVFVDSGFSSCLDLTSVRESAPVFRALFIHFRRFRIFAFVL